MKDKTKLFFAWIARFFSSWKLEIVIFVISFVMIFAPAFSRDKGLALNYISCIFAVFTGCVSIYLFLLQFSSKVELVSIDGNLSFHRGATMIITLWNRSLSPICIDAAWIVLDNKYRLKIPFESKIITIEARKIESFSFKYTRLDPPPNLDKVVEYRAQNTSLSPEELINLTNGVFVNRPRKGLFYLKFPHSKALAFDDLEEVHPVLVMYEGKVLSRYTKYAVILYNKYREKKTLFVCATGDLSQSFHENENSIPPEYLKDLSSLEAYFRRFFTENSDVRVDFKSFFSDGAELIVGPIKQK